MGEEKEIVGTRLEHLIAQTKADIAAIDERILGLQAEAKILREQQVELVEVLVKIEPSTVEESVAL